MTTNTNTNTNTNTTNDALPNAKHSQHRMARRLRGTPRAELRACPYCGNDNLKLQGELDFVVQAGRESGWAHIWCPKCTAVGPAASTAIGTTRKAGWLEARAIQKWNARRADEGKSPSETSSGARSADSAQDSRGATAPSVFPAAPGSANCKRRVRNEAERAAGAEPGETNL